MADTVDMIIGLILVAGPIWFIWFLLDTMNVSINVFKTRQGRCRGSGHHPNCNCANFF